MKRHAMPSTKEGAVNVTPLIDVVMVLIVFFMLVAKIGVTRGADEDIPLPSALYGKQLDSMSNTLTMNIHWNKSGDEPLVDALVDGQVRPLHVTKKYSSGTDYELGRALEAFEKQYPGTANLIIHADKDLPYSQLELVLLACAQAGIGNVSYETKSGPDLPEGPTASAQP